MIERDGRSVPGSYGDSAKEYAAVRDRAGLLDLSSRGRILVSGTEAIQFLNGLITNDMKTLEANTWMPAAFPNVQGRLIAAVRVIRLKDDETGKQPSPTFLLDSETATHQAVFKNIERFTFAGDFHVNDVTNSTAMLSVQGRKAAGIIASVLGDEAGSATANSAVQVNWPVDGVANELTIVHASHTGEDGFDLVVNVEQATLLWEELERAGATPVGYDALETLRIEAGIPRFGVDMDETNIVTETNLDDAVSFTKGCYVGQEIIARIKYRGHVAKKLSGLVFDSAPKIEAGDTIESVDGKEIGRVTSVAYSPALKRTIALGYLKYDYLASGTPVAVVTSEDRIAGQVADLPFVQPGARATGD